MTERLAYPFTLHFNNGQNYRNYDPVGWISFGKEDSKHIVLCHDAILIAESVDNLQRFNKWIPKRMWQINMEISKGKPKLVLISREPLKYTINK